MLPNKVTRVEDSILWKLPYILDELNLSDMEIVTLFDKLNKKFNNVNEYIFCLDILYALNKIDYIKEIGVIKIVN